MFVSYNGEILDAEAPLLPPSSRTLKFGDSFFETMRFFKGQIFNLPSHFNRLELSAFALEADLNPLVSTIDNFRDEVTKVIEQNNIENGMIRFTVCRNGAAAYNAPGRTTSFLIEVKSQEPETFVLAESGISIAVHPEIKKQFTSFSFVKTGSMISQVMAAAWCNRNNYSDCLLLNGEGNIAEGLTSNVFVCKDGEVITPTLSDGCVMGTMRSLLISILKQEKITVREASVTVEQATAADEIFLSNASGLRWVRTFNGNDYSCDMSRNLTGFLNTLV